MTEHKDGDRVVVKADGFKGKGVVVDKTRGDSTKIQFDDGPTMLIANKAIRKEKN